MIIRETKNIEEIKSILCHPEIFNRIKGNHYIDADNFIPPLDDVLYFGGYDDGIFGVSCFHSYRDGLKFHPNVLPSYRLKYGRDFVKLSLSMVKCKIYIEIPKERKRLFNLAEKLGFDSISNNKDSTNTILMRLI